MPNLSQIKKNTFWLILFQLAKMVFPFLILPILTRRLSVEVYGNLTYVKTVMNFLQIFVDFGFMLSATKELAKINHQKADHTKIEQVITNTLFARILLGLLGLVIVLVLCIFITILHQLPFYPRLLFCCFSLHISF